MARMVGRTGHPPCGSRCCGDRTARAKRSRKRSEDQGWQREVRQAEPEPCEHPEVYPDGCCDEHGGRVDVCARCGEVVG